MTMLQQLLKNITNGFQNILNIVESTLMISSRRISALVIIPQIRVFRICHMQGLNPYYVCVHHLQLKDYDCCMQFCRWINNNPHVSGIMLTDEEKFTRDGIINTCNSHV